jgi:hypothetical protein
LVVAVFEALVAALALPLASSRADSAESLAALEALDAVSAAVA